MGELVKSSLLARIVLLTNLFRSSWLRMAPMFLKLVSIRVSGLGEFSSGFTITFET